MDERVHRYPRQLAQMGARFAQANAGADDRPDAEALPDELVEADAAGDDVTTRLRSRQPDRLEYFGLDQRQMHAGLIGVVRPSAHARVVAVAYQTAARDRARACHEPRRCAGCISDENLFH